MVSISDKRKAYMRGKYSKYWITARTEIHGTMADDVALIDLIKIIRQ